MLNERLPLHPAQKDVYIDQLVNIENPNYNVGGYLVLKGELKIECFKRVVNSIPRVFDVFKMQFDLNSDEPCCYFEDNDGYEVTELDYSSYDNPEIEARLWLQNQFNTPFSLKAGSQLFEQFFIKISENEHWHFIRCHHLLTDGYGFAIIHKYIAEKYIALLTDTELQFNYIPYKDEISKAFQYYNSDSYEAEGLYWKQKINQKPKRILRRNYSNTSGNTEKSTRYIFKFEEDQRQRLSEIQLNTHSSLQQLTIAALMIYYGQISGHSDFVFGIPIHRRTGRKQRNTVGMFAGVIPLKGSYHKELKLVDFINSIALSQKQDYRNSNYLASDLSKNIKEDHSDNYLFEITINYELFDFEANFGNDLKGTINHLSSENQRYPLQLSWRDYGKQQHLELHVDYWNTYFNDVEIEALTKNIIFILEQFTQKLNESIGRINILSPEQIKKLLPANEYVEVDYPRDKTITDLFEEEVNKSRDKIALVFEETEITYNELNDRANRLAYYLLSLGVKKGALVAICLERSLEMIVAIIAVLKAGGAYVPIDPDYPEERIGYILGDTNASVIISNKLTVSKLMVYSACQAIALDGDDWLEIQKMPGSNLFALRSSSDLAYVIYTSGSTGKPKGVMVRHNNLADYVFGLQQSIQVDKCQSFALVSELFTDLGNTVLYSSLIFGATLHILHKSVVNNGDKAIAYFNKKTIDCLKITPSHWRALSSGDRLLLPCKLLIFGGETLSASIAAQIHGINTSCKIINHYGPTETTIGKLLHIVENGKKYDKVIPIGKPFSNSYVRILTKDLALCPIGSAGELYIGGHGVSAGYLNNPELTNLKFIQDPFLKSKEAIIYRTDDIVRLQSDGNIVFIGRVDDQVKIRGYRVEIGEIETILLQSKLVDQAVVLAKENATGNMYLAAYIVRKPGFNQEAINYYLKGCLPEFMIPSFWIGLEAFPLMSNGKVDKKSLPEVDTQLLRRNEYAAPGTLNEKKLTKLWQDLLKADTVGINDNFFELGGDSLIAIRMVSAIFREFKVELSVRNLFQNASVSLLAKYLDKAAEETSLPLIGVQKRSGSIPLSFGQERMWFIDQLKGSTQYHEPAVFKIKGVLNNDALAYAFKNIVSRHEVLRTVIKHYVGTPYQEVLPADLWQLDEINHFYQKQTHNLQNQIKELIYTPFDLAKDYPLRVHLIKTEDNEHILVVVIHHIASDGWSVPIIATEVAELYRSYLEKRPFQLVAPAIQYIDYAIWQRQYQSGLTDKNLEYWQTKLQRTSNLNLPTDYSRPAVQSNKGAAVSIAIDKDLTNEIQSLSQMHGCTLYMALLAAFKVLLYKYTGHKDICVGTPIVNRGHKELENVIGFFVNTVAVRSNLSDDSPFTTLLQVVKENVLEAYEHQETPFEQVVDAVVKERDLSRSPLFQIMFMLQNATHPVLSEKMLPGLELSRLAFKGATSKFDLTFNIANSAAGMEVEITYCTDLFKEDTITRMGHHFEQLLRSIVKKPSVAISKLSMLSEAKEQQHEADLNTANTVYKEISLVSEDIAKTPDKSATELNYLAPKNATEEKLVEIWEEVLGKKGIGVKDNFFDWGGTSMKIAKVVGLVNKRFDKRISIVAAFKFPNIQALADYINSEDKTDAKESDEDINASVSMMEQTVNLFNNAADEE